MLKTRITVLLTASWLIACGQPQATSIAPAMWQPHTATFNAQGQSTRRLAVKLRATRLPQALLRQGANTPTVVHRLAPLHVVILESSANTSASQLARELAQDGAVAWAEPTVSIQAEGVPNDPLVSKQTHLPQIKAFDAWRVSRGDAKVPLAILDTGIDTSHPEFTGRLHAASRNILAPGQPPEDDYGHGNHVAGVAAAAADNGIGVAGVAPAAHLMIVKIMDANGRGDDATFAAGLIHAVDSGARVVSMSFGAGRRSPLFEEALRYALERDVVLVASAGNDNVRNDRDKRPHLPSTFPGVIEVAATDGRDRKASFSNYGDTVSVAAPGVDIFATYRSKFGGYGKFSGTSMATPMVAALATMVRGLNPTWTRQQVREHLERTADDLGPAGRDPQFGAGRINCARAVSNSQ